MSNFAPSVNRLEKRTLNSTSYSIKRLFHLFNFQTLQFSYHPSTSKEAFETILQPADSTVNSSSQNSFLTQFQKFVKNGPKLTEISNFNTPKIVCEICSCCFRSLNELKYHKEVQCNENNNKKEPPKKKPKIKKKVKKKLTVNPNSLFQCMLCNEKIDTVSAETHQCENNQNVYVEVKCDFCDESFRTYESHLEHVISHKQTSVSNQYE